MWHDDNDEILQLLNKVDMTLDKALPCPICNSENSHVYFQKHDESHCGMWAWCSDCKAFAHVDGEPPIWWENPNFIDENVVCAVPDYLEENKAKIDKWVIKLKQEQPTFQLKCERCGSGNIVYKLSKRECGFLCVDCGWGIATSFFEPIELDRTNYSVVLLENSEINADTIKAVSHIANVNYLQAKKILEEGNTEVFKGLATEVNKVKSELTDNKITFMIEPDFPY